MDDTAYIGNMNLNEQIYEAVTEIKVDVAVLKSSFSNLRESIISDNKNRSVAEVNLQNENADRDKRILATAVLAEKINTQWKIVAVLVGVISPVLLLIINHFWK